MSANKRDDFSEGTKRILRERTGGRCSNPACNEPTLGPHSSSDKSVSIGQAAHITAARPGGPRFDPTLTKAQRVHADNGLWCCNNCARLVDLDASTFTVDQLRAWKVHAEARARKGLKADGRPQSAPAAVTEGHQVNEAPAVQSPFIVGELGQQLKTGITAQQSRLSRFLAWVDTASHGQRIALAVAGITAGGVVPAWVTMCRTEPPAARPVEAPNSTARTERASSPSVPVRPTIGPDYYVKGLDDIRLFMPIGTARQICGSRCTEQGALLTRSAPDTGIESVSYSLEDRMATFGGGTIIGSVTYDFKDVATYEAFLADVANRPTSGPGIETVGGKRIAFEAGTNFAVSLDRSNFGTTWGRLQYRIYAPVPASAFDMKRSGDGFITGPPPTPVPRTSANPGPTTPAEAVK